MRPLLLVLALVGCGKKDRCDHELEPERRGTGGDDVFDGYAPADCVPDEAAWQAVAPVVEERCGSCHGVEPAFGAPQTLTTYDGLVAGTPGLREADRLARRAATRTMPPASSPELTHDELDLLVSWATCGAVHPDPTVGLQVDREVYAADVPENLALPSFDVVADGFAVGPDVLDHYQCFVMDLPLEEPRHLRRIQVVLDDARVLHHAVLVLDPGGAGQEQGAVDCDALDTHSEDLLWAWAPGTGAFDFEDGGLRMEPGDRAILEIHYNNGAGAQDVVDSSGIRLFHGPVEGPEWTIFDAGPVTFEVPQGESAVCSETEVFRPTRILASMPHMHELGAELHSSVVRASDGIEEGLLNLTGWSFEAQQIYRVDAVVEEGDVVKTWCGYRNGTGRMVRSGLGTGDEMCFDFLYTTPL